MRTLTKERVSPSALFNNSGALSLDLIGDGPNETLCKKLSNFQENNKKFQIMVKQKNVTEAEQNKLKNRKWSFTMNFMIFAYRLFGINYSQIGELSDQEITALYRLVCNKAFRVALFSGIFTAVGLLLSWSLGWSSDTNIIRGLISCFSFVISMLVLFPFSLVTTGMLFSMSRIKLTLKKQFSPVSVFRENYEEVRKSF